jgi:prepilin-type N-terminal cleavage/methylation domain-containing protein
MTLRAQKRRAAAGFTLVELLVAIVISLVLTLAITTVLIRTEGSKRTTTSVNDINATGSYAAFVLDRAVRSAGLVFRSVGKTLLAAASTQAWAVRRCCHLLRLHLAHRQRSRGCQRPWSAWHRW